MSLALQAAISGVFFGIWPLCMNRSGLSGTQSSLAFIVATLCFLLPIGFSERTGFGNANMKMIALAGLASALGVFFFNTMLARAKPEEVSTFFVIMILVQTAVPAVYQMALTHSLSPSRLAGFTLAGAAGALLLR